MYEVKWLKCVIEWKYYGTVRDVYLFGYYENEEYNNPPMFYATSTKKKPFITALQSLGQFQTDLKKTQVSWKLRDAALIDKALGERDLTLDTAEEGLPDEILLYIGKTSRPLVYRLVDGHNPGAAVPIYLLSIARGESPLLSRYRLH